ncbi:hypothetical protein HZS_24 [Henneguya salminicola]|nr:hypothetical protein HZS_24 [Henneguya salminicola]
MFFRENPTKIKSPYFIPKFINDMNSILIGTRFLLQNEIYPIDILFATLIDIICTYDQGITISQYFTHADIEPLKIYSKNILTNISEP